MEEELEVTLWGLRIDTRGQKRDQHARREDTRGNMPWAHRQPTEHIYFLLYTVWKKITRGQFPEVPTPMIFMKRVAEMALAEKQNEGLIFENRTGAKVNDLQPDDEANEAFNKINGNITGVEWEAETEIQEPATHVPQINNNRYASLADEEENEGNDNNS